MSRNKKRGKKSKNNLRNRNRILLIVENSEEIFFTRYFKKYLADKYAIEIKCIRSGRAGICNITNGLKMTAIINDALNIEKYKAVFLMLDLKTKCFNSDRNHTCLIKLKNDYRPRYDNIRQKDRFYLFVVCSEIESWFLTINEKIDHTNNIHEDHKHQLKKFLGVNTEPKIVDKIIKGLSNGKYKLNFSKNKSLQHFIKKLQEFNAKP